MTYSTVLLWRTPDNSTRQSENPHQERVKDYLLNTFPTSDRDIPHYFTLANARETGEKTPDGKRLKARWKSAAVFWQTIVYNSVTPFECPCRLVTKFKTIGDLGFWRWLFLVWFSFDLFFLCFTSCFIWFLEWYFFIPIQLPCLLIYSYANRDGRDQSLRQTILGA